MSICMSQNRYISTFQALSRLCYLAVDEPCDNTSNIPTLTIPGHRPRELH